MSEEQKPGSLPSWWPSDDKPAPTAPDPAAAPPAPAQPGPPNPDAAAHIARQMPSWWKPEFQTAAKFSTPEAPTEATPAPEPPAPVPPPPVPEATVPPPATQPAPPPPVTPAPPSNQPARTMVLPTPQVAPPVAILTVTGGPDAGFKFRIKPNAVATIGREVDSEVVLNDPATSRRHAQIEFKDGKYVLADLGSANGTLVNDQRIKERALSDGDVIKVGQNVIAISIKAV